ncbi:hypothetical protein [Paraburkholderia tagetis]|uniref:Uncharacterized protein n=1 Tax=Paraburkholderia tagetis TaxID=2913261 RepID=A0A9X1ZXC2_9BURK|nr:hypothetical protein [Paraburkholderia tagetis]MCG5077673.1 hypothetical protein [Paraburkholderia tagetis]
MSRRFFAGISLFLWLLWGMQLAIGTLLTVSGWFMAEDLGTTFYVQFGLVLLGAALGQIACSLYGMWQWRVACQLHFEDVWDGVCPDSGDDIEDVWRWYVKRGKPWRLDPNRPRPLVRFQDGWRRMEAYSRASNADQNHRV